LASGISCGFLNIPTEDDLHSRVERRKSIYLSGASTGQAPLVAAPFQFLKPGGLISASCAIGTGSPNASASRARPSDSSGQIDFYGRIKTGSGRTPSRPARSIETDNRPPGPQRPYLLARNISRDLALSEHLGTHLCFVQLKGSNEERIQPGCWTDRGWAPISPGSFARPAPFPFR
jgi:hypothetical protein